jgi:soluble lytic murein transglycosylase-like protein
MNRFLFFFSARLTYVSAVIFTALISVAPAMPSGSVASVSDAFLYSSSPHYEDVNYAVRLKRLSFAISRQYQIPEARASSIVLGAHQVSATRNIDPLLLLAIVGTESAFNPHAVNASGAAGLTQVLPCAHKEQLQVLRRHGLSIFNEHANLDMGALILQEYLEKNSGNRILALQEYSGNLKDPHHRYAKKVLKLYNFLLSVQSSASSLAIVSRASHLHYARRSS